jgi:hypothetical protein
MDERGAKPGALEADSLRQSGSEAYGGRCVIPSEGCTERRNAKAENYDDSVDGHDGTKGKNRNPGAGPEGRSRGYTRGAGRGMLARTPQPAKVTPRSSPSGDRVKSAPTPFGGRYERRRGAQRCCSSSRRVPQR